MFVFGWTVVIAALSMTIALKVLRLFHLLKWSPAEIVKPLRLEDAHWLAKWGAIFIFCIILAAIVYLIGSYIANSIIIALVLGVVITIAIEWRFHEQVDWRTFSIPLAVVVILVVYFICETAYFYHEKMKLRAPK